MIQRPYMTLDVFDVFSIAKNVHEKWCHIMIDMWMLFVVFIW